MKGRNIKKSSPSHWVEQFYDCDENRSKMCESNTEFCACIERFIDPDITGFETHPFTVTFMLQGKMRRYSPDAIILQRDGRVVFEEVKLENWVPDLTFEAKRRAFTLTTGSQLVVRKVRKCSKYRKMLMELYTRYQLQLLDEQPRLH
ncbi:hypothetical protein [Neptunicella sp. SCSIO 80796]|uniref:hypothetical protein n=1 Tax=Neptunicella plasticusilytica TaxID=3117012 RepID=UPI003A4DFAB7